MKAVIMREYGGPQALSLAEVPDPVPDQDGVLVQVRACGVCGHDVLARRGELKTPLPMILGHEVSGVVAAVGGAVRQLRVGDRVALVQRDPCGKCRHCRAGATNHCRQGRGFYGEDQPGGYAEYVLASERNAVVLPPDIDDAAGAILSCAIGTGWHALARVRAAAGEVAVVTGAGGGVGLHALQLARYLGMHVIAATGSAAKRDRLLEIGAEDVAIVGEGHDSLRDQVKAVTGGLLADVVLEVAGAPTFGSSVSALAPLGRLALIGNVDPQDLSVRPGLVILKELSVVGSAHATKKDLEAVVSLVTAGHVTPLIAEAIPLEEARRAHGPIAENYPLGRRVLVSAA